MRIGIRLLWSKQNGCKEFNIIIISIIRLYRAPKENVRKSVSKRKL